MLRILLFPVISIILVKKFLFSGSNNVALKAFNFEWDILVIFSAVKTQEISTDWKCSLHLEKQFIQNFWVKNWKKNFSSFRKSQSRFTHFFWILRTLKMEFDEILVCCMANILTCFWLDAGDWKLVPGPFMILLKL